MKKIVDKAKKYAKSHFNESYNNMCLRKNKKSSVQNGQVIFMRLDGIGDFVLWISAAKKLCESYCDNEKILLCTNPVVPLAESLGWFDKVVGIDLSKFCNDLSYKMYIVKMAKKWKGSILIQTVYSRSIGMDILSSVIPAFRKITFDGDTTNIDINKKAKTDKIYDELVCSSKGQKMELIRNAELVRGLGIKEYKAEVCRLPIYNTEKVPQKKFYVVVPGTSDRRRDWSVVLFDEVIKKIQKKADVICVLVGSKHEEKYGEYLEGKNRGDFFCNMIGKTSILEMIEIIRNAEFVITGDTSAVHFAMATRTKTICIVGGWEYGRFIPYKTENDEDFSEDLLTINAVLHCYGCNHKKHEPTCLLCQEIFNKWQCIHEISFCDVWNAVEKVLQKG